MKKKTQDRFEEKRENEVLKNEEGYKLSTIENLKTRIKLAFTSMKENNGLTMKIIAGAGLLTAASTVLVACDFGKDDENDSNDNNNNNENNNGGTINPGDGEENPDKDPEKPTEPEPGPPVDPGEPENPDKPVDPTPGDEFKIPEKYQEMLSKWGEAEVEYLIDAYTKMYGQKLFNEGRFDGVLYNKTNFSIAGLQLDDVANSVKALIKYNEDGDSEKNIRFAEKTMTFNSEVNLKEYLQKITAYRETFGKDGSEFDANKFKVSEENLSVNRSTAYFSTTVNRDTELESSRMDEMENILSSFNKVGQINHVFYAKNSQSPYGATGAVGEGYIWSMESIVLDANNHLQKVNMEIAISANLNYNKPEMILDFWDNNNLVENTNYKVKSSSITENSFGGENAALNLSIFYQNEKTKDYERE